MMATQNPNWNEQYADNIRRQKLLVEYLRGMGDERLGGSTPLGGKAFALEVVGQV